MADTANMADLRLSPDLSGKNDREHRVMAGGKNRLQSQATSRRGGLSGQKGGKHIQTRLISTLLELPSLPYLPMTRNSSISGPNNVSYSGMAFFSTVPMKGISASFTTRFAE